MKLFPGVVFCAAVFALGQVARAGDADVTVSCQPKKFENKVTAGKPSDEVKKTQMWGYSVTVENKTFKPMTDLEVKYIIFSKRQQLGMKGPGRKQHDSGSYTIKEIAPNDKVTFDTDSIALTKAMLIGQSGGYSYFTNGAKPKAEDSLTGLWIRIYQNGNLFTEFANPAELTSKETWE
jgi:hypothetical protein